MRLNTAGTAFVRLIKLMQLAGMDGDDIIYGTGGIETLDGGLGADSLYGMAGNDVLRGGAGADYLEGGAGSDWLSGADGADTMRGGDGVDHIEFSGDIDSIDRIEDLAATDVLYLLGYGSAITYARVEFDSASQMLVVPTTTPKRVMLPGVRAKPVTAQIKFERPSTPGTRRA
jgi:hypothetical protein